MHWVVVQWYIKVSVLFPAMLIILLWLLHLALYQWLCMPCTQISFLTSTSRPAFQVWCRNDPKAEGVLHTSTRWLCTVVRSTCWHGRRYGMMYLPHLCTILPFKPFSPPFIWPTYVHSLWILYLLDTEQGVCVQLSPRAWCTAWILHYYFIETIYWCSVNKGVKSHSSESVYLVFYSTVSVCSCWQSSKTYLPSSMAPGHRMRQWLQ